MLLPLGAENDWHSVEASLTFFHVRLSLPASSSAHAKGSKDHHTHAASSPFTLLCPFTQPYYLSENLRLITGRLSLDCLV